MVKVIMGLKGSGKTKQLIELVHKALDEENGDVVCIEKDPTLRYSIPSKARHVYISTYGGKKGADFLKGFLSGIHAGNYDITHIFIDGLYKLIDETNTAGVDEFIEWLAKFSEEQEVSFTLTVSADAAHATETMKKYI